MKSIITDDLEHCIVSGKDTVAIHHVLEGNKRKLSNEDGLVIPLHPALHNMGYRSKAGQTCDVHHCNLLTIFSHIMGQCAWERHYIAKRLSEITGEPVEDIEEDALKAFRNRYGKSYR